MRYGETRRLPEEVGWLGLGGGVDLGDEEIRVDMAEIKVSVLRE